MKGNPHPNPPDNTGKIYNVRPTPKQVRVFENMVKEGASLSDAIKSAGYSRSVQRKPQEAVLSTAGFQKLLNDYLPDSLILGSLKEDITKKPQKRVRELELAAKIKGWMKETPQSQTNVNVGVIVLPSRPVDNLSTTSDIKEAETE